ncbi:MAG: acetylglutamate kinase [bacterium]|nr:acetylglutamate kinase [bacterium]
MKIILIKFGGSLFSNEHNREKFWQDVQTLRSSGIHVIIVHGGGKEISKWIEKVGSQVQFVEGLRYTDDEIMDIVEMVLSGKLNKQLVTECGRDAIGLSGRDANLIIANNVKELGLVGKPAKMNIDILKKLCNLNCIPIISPVSNDADGQHLNVNADDAANAIAIALKVDALVFMTDMPGVLDGKGETITHINKGIAQDFKKRNIIHSGMLVKISSAFSAIEQGVKSVNIIDGREYGIIKDIFIKGEEKGTRVE